MARIETVNLIDDLDGGPADETVPFGWEGKPLSIDLSAANAAKLRAILADYVAAARRAPNGTRKARTPAPTSAHRRETQACRTWLREHGIAVAERGRIPATFRMAYDQDRPELAKG